MEKVILVWLMLFVLSCSSLVGREHKYAGDSTEEYPYVKIDKFDRWLKTCSKIGCIVYTSTNVSFHNPTDRYVKGRVKCTYYYGGVEHGVDNSRSIFLAPKKSIGISFTYMFDLAFNVTSKVGVGCEAVYVYNSDYSINHIRAGFDSSVIKIYRTQKQYVYKDISTPSK